MAAAIALDTARIEELADEIAELEAHITAAGYRQLVAIRELDRLEGWAVQGATSCAAWLSWRIGLSPAAARERVRMAHALEDLPQMSTAHARGEVSYSQVRALTRIATSEDEGDWLNIARHSTAAQLERMVRSCRQAAARNAPEHEEVEQQSRELLTYHDDDGMVVLRGRLPAEAGAALIAALDAIQEALPVDQRSETHSQRRADALVEMADRSRSSGEGGSGAERQTVVVHVDAAVLADPTAAGRCELEHGPCVSAEAAQRLACDAAVIHMEHGARGEVLSVGRKTRTLSAALRRALRERDRGCRFPGCSHRRVDGHHLQHWAAGGETRLDNIVSLCRRHHTAVHEGGFTIELDAAGDFVFRGPDGSLVSAGGLLPEVAAGGGVGPETLAERHRELGLALRPETFACGWDGERPDYGYITQVMISRA